MPRPVTTRLGGLHAVAGSTPSRIILKEKDAGVTATVLDGAVNFLADFLRDAELEGVAAFRAATSSEALAMHLAAARAGVSVLQVGDAAPEAVCAMLARLHGRVIITSPRGGDPAEPSEFRSFDVIRVDVAAALRGEALEPAASRDTPHERVGRVDPEVLSASSVLRYDVRPGSTHLLAMPPHRMDALGCAAAAICGGGEVIAVSPRTANELLLHLQSSRAVWTSLTPSAFTALARSGRPPPKLETVVVFGDIEADLPEAWREAVVQTRMTRDEEVWIKPPTVRFRRKRSVGVVASAHYWRDEAAVIEADTGRILTRGAFLERASAFGAAVQRATDSRGVVLVVADQTADALAAVVGTVAIGLDVAVAGATARTPQLAAIVEQVSPAAAIVPSGVGSRTVDDLRSLEVPMVHVDLNDTPRMLEMGSPAGRVIFFTSGTTTGRGRASLPNLQRRLCGTAQTSYAASVMSAVGIPASGPHLVAGAIAHAAQLRMALAALDAGQPVVLLEKWGPARALAAIEHWRVASTFLVPSMIGGLLALSPEYRAGYDLSCLSAVIHGGAPCPPPWKRALIEWVGPIVYEMYGAVGLLGTYCTSAEWLARPGTVGLSFPGARVLVTRPDGTPCQPMEVGSVQLLDPSRSHESLGHSAGDLGYLDADGWLFLAGREDDMILVGGSNVYTWDVEVVLLEHEMVKAAVVVGVPHPRLGNCVKAFVELTGSAPSAAIAIKAIRAFARERLKREAVPRHIEVVAAIPHTDAGKPDRRAMRGNVGA